jgi:Protein of unknown function DUF262/Protein of unknown function (DUF1524)
LTDQCGKPANYWIPAYQRGYRWTQLMVTQLLDDLWEFIQAPNAGQFYCLQPIVIKPLEDGRLEVVDGQQRLTTIYILLTYLKDLLPHFDGVRFRLTFATRGEANEAFLADIDQSRAEENVDFYHICQAFRAIEQWFSGGRSTYRIKLLTHLLNTDELGRNVKVIWFELGEDDKPVNAFTRLNVGKIALTDDELIRALFLRRSNINDRETEARQRKIAHEWDEIEKALQNDSFWYFLNKVGKAQNRIGFLLELVARSEGIPLEFAQAQNPVFLTFSKKLSVENANHEKEWLKIKEQFMRLEEWYENRLLYHMVGFLVHESVSLDEISRLAKGCTKSDFRLKLRQRIFAETIGGPSPADLNQDDFRTQITTKLQDLDYESDRRRILSVLLLFNIATLHENSQSQYRFRFDSFKKQSWNIEHIRSIASDPPDSYSGRVEWLGLCAEYLRNRISNEATKEKDLLAEIVRFEALDKEAAEPQFGPIYKKLLDHFDEDGETEPDHGIANLALLDEGTNKSYKNAPFAVKRDRLLSRDKDGLFVPLCTRNVFMKCYNRRASNLMFWSVEDRAAYENAMIETLTNFLSGQTEGAQ